MSADKELQDSWAVRNISPSTVAAAVADGAGSEPLSARGAKTAAEDVVEKLGWLVRDVGEPFDDPSWSALARRAFSQTRSEVERIAAEDGVPAERYSSTLIAMLVTDHGVGTAHVGDGRAGVKSSKEGWISTMTPFQGEVSSSTVFLVTPWATLDAGSLHFETRWHFGPVDAFALCTDGMERAAWTCRVWAKDTEVVVDPNMPHGPFLDPLCETLSAAVSTDHDSADTLQSEWERFLGPQSPLQVIREEDDDKTLLIGVCVAAVVSK